jgi:Kelch motif protein
MRYRALAAATVVTVTLALPSCDSSIEAPRLDQLSFELVSGNGQTGVVGSDLAPLIVKVTSGGNPVAQQVLNFRVISGGGSVYGGTELTDDHGIAQEIWTLGTNASAPQKVEVRAVESNTGAQKVFGTFTATATPAPASAISVQAGNGQTAVAGAALPISPTVQVSDQFGNPIGGVIVTFAVTAGGGGVVNASQPTGTNGNASAGTWTLGPQAGPNTLTATSPGLTGSPVMFTAAGMVGTAAQLVVLSGNNQFASPSATLPNQPTVRVVDANGNGVPNVAVTFTVTSGGGSIGGVGSVTTLSAATNAGVVTGSAQVPWTLGSAAGTNTLQATAVGLSGSPLVFTATSACNCWTSKTFMPTPRDGAGVGVISGLIYIATGSAPGTFGTTANEAYDPMTDTWVGKAPAPTNRAYVGSGVIGGKLYVVGGCINSDCNSTTNILEIYDPVANRWTTGAPMPTARFYVAAAVINDKLYVVGGAVPGSTLGTLEVYDPLTDTWAAKASLPTTTATAAAAVVNGVLYVIGGGNSSGYIGTVQVYDPATDTWTTKAPLPTATGGSAVGVVSGIIYVAGGQSAPSSAVNTVEAYDPTADSWTARAGMPTARQSLMGAVVNGRFYAIGGVNGSNVALTTNEAYQP